MYTHTTFKQIFFAFLLSFLLVNSVSSQFTHPGISHKKSDLDRMKFMVEAQIDPWYTSYQNMVDDSKSSYDYEVQGKSTFTILARDAPRTNYSEWNSDIRAAYYNAIRWYITGDTRHADKAVEIFKAWSNLTAVTSGGTEALSGGVGYIMIEAAEIIKSTYSGWSTSDIDAFKAMLVYPGYSNTEVPDSVTGTNGTFYWRSYQGDAARHGNQGLSGWRTCMAMGIFLDNEIMYDRALRYLKGLPHRSDDLPYVSGPNTSTSLVNSTPYADTYNIVKGTSIPDYGFNEVLTNYFWENGQCQESSRDQAHAFFGSGLLSSMAEMAWNQGEDLYSNSNNRLLLGLEYTLRYNVSYVATYPDQTSPWEPTVASGEFIQRFDRTGRWYSKGISPDARGDFTKNRPCWEMPVAHFIGRGFKTNDEAKWTLRARDKSIELSGYERAGWTNDAIGWGGLTFRRPKGCHGDPIRGFSSQMPNYEMHVLPGIIEAENYDYSPIDGEGRTYHDTSSGNSGNEYRTNENVDIEICSEGGYNLGYLDTDEWITYTVYIPETDTYDISVRYAGITSNGSIQFDFDNQDKTGAVVLPITGGSQSWDDFVVKEGIVLSKGVQSMKINIGGGKHAFNLNNISITSSSSCAVSQSVSPTDLLSEISYDYYEGTWNALPDFDQETIIRSGTATNIGLGNGEANDFFAYVFKGYIEIPTEGNYTFYTTSDDGSNLFIDDVKIVNNDGTHGPEEKSGSICLTQGYHKIEVSYFDKSGGDVLSVAYEGPGIVKQEISNFYYRSETLGISNQLDTTFNVYPNPFKETLTIRSKETSIVKLELINMVGQIVFSKGSIKHKESVNLESIPTGLYIAKITGDSKVVTQTLIKQ